MRAAFTIAALAAGALAAPYNKRELRTEVDMVYVTDVVTVTAGQPIPTSAVAAKVTPAVHQVQQAAPSPPAAFAQSVEQAAPSVQAASAPVPSVSVPTLPLPGSGNSDYQTAVLTAHNVHRQNHSVSDLQWDEGLAASAATIAMSCVYAHNVDVNGGGYGQNIAAGVDTSNVSSVITDMFYNGEEPLFANLYGQASPSMDLFESWGHFSQIVWAGTTHVACATQYCPGGLANTGGGIPPYFTVCNYSPPGNYAGEYAVNVKQPVGMPTAQWNTGL